MVWSPSPSAFNPSPPLSVCIYFERFRSKSRKSIYISLEENFMRCAITECFCAFRGVEAREIIGVVCLLVRDCVFSGPSFWARMGNLASRSTFPQLPLERPHLTTMTCILFPVEIPECEDFCPRWQTNCKQISICKVKYTHFKWM